MPFTHEKLEALRKQFGGNDGGSMVTPEFQRIAQHIFSVGGRREAPYSGFPTLLDAPGRVIDAETPDFSNLQVALYGVPMDLAVTNRNGSLRPTRSAGN